MIDRNMFWQLKMLLFLKRSNNLALNFAFWDTFENLYLLLILKKFYIISWVKVVSYWYRSQVRAANLSLQSLF